MLKYLLWNELALACDGDCSDYERVSAGRMIVMCEASHLAVENAAKVITVLG